MKYSFNYFFFLLLILVLFGCNSQTVFEQNSDIEQGKWAKEDVRNFEFQIEDASINYNIYYYVRNTVGYPFHNLYLKYSLENSKGDVLETALQNMLIFDEKTGKPMGSGLGDIFDQQILSIENYNFSDTGTYHFNVNQYMRRDTLNDIISIGIKIEKANND